MTSQAQGLLDPLEVLLPDCGPAAREAANRLITCLRLLADDARGTSCGRVAASLERARGELEQELRARLHAALRDLLIHHLRAALGPESFLEVGEPAGAAQEAWSALEGMRAEVSWAPGVPEPGEAAQSVARRLLEAARRAELPGPELDLCQARLERAAGGPEGGERAFRALLEAAARSGAEPSLFPGIPLSARNGGPACRSEAGPELRRSALAGLAACLLDRGAVGEARALLEENRALAFEGREGSRLARLLSWSRLLQGDVEEARALDLPECFPPPRLPLPLARLREERPEWMPLLAGRPEAEPMHVPRAPLSRRALGAAVLALLEIRPDGEAKFAWVDAAPAARKDLEAWLEERSVAPLDGIESECLARGRAVAAHRAEGRTLSGALLSERCRSMAVAPIGEPSGEIVGLLRIELEHHLVPSEARLAAAAEAARERLPGNAPGAGVPWVERSTEALARSAGGAPSAEVFEALVRALGIKTAQRHWWGLTLEGGKPRLAAEGGGALAVRERWSGGRRALRRALASRSPVAFDEPDERLSISSEAASGIALPLLARGVPCGVLAIESARRRDRLEVDGPRVRAALECAGLALRAAQFRSWHQETAGRDVLFDPSDAADRALIEEVLAAGRSRAPVVVGGAPGSGKLVLARWLHFEGGAADRPLVIHVCGSGPLLPARRSRGAGRASARPGAGLSSAERSRGGTLVVRGPEELAPEDQSRLVEWLEGEDGALGIGASDAAPRLVFTRREGIEPQRERAEAGAALRPELARRLARLRVCAPSLAQRRNRIPALAAFLVRRLAQEENLRAPVLEESALAALWRQPWSGNVAELESLVHRAVLMRPGEPLDQEGLASLARRQGLELLSRLPSRHPDPEVVRAALEAARSARGSFNKSRAAVLLGWDPDTLASRMREMGLGEEASPRQDPAECLPGVCSATPSEAAGGP